ncbi:E3 ubiquitin-protein ligase hel2 [Colletotrichum truncatum]|uniref:E3 ubiquitin-protein ligase hel2 n=1 Tax=Colletotrichum truncatum TaxID=5467 RepID=A0ACC3Z2K3_COLTU|nr:E3 ubiquitin-protein ligase hel2 [Colletotrichum truncatum]XP_036576036.1 E3 ubiquitin-protein ligase hel2 [Colletotrichum truncatum]KAF6780594.1 E3 ubiquitin-protein ligase hel2 [Colletotrichum truncatum]KAF6782707.1 E3 ubiquitin-protein ligase hel2 [Colletotrichum truncatum]
MADAQPAADSSNPSRGNRNRGRGRGGGGGGGGGGNNAGSRGRGQRSGRGRGGNNAGAGAHTNTPSAPQVAPKAESKPLARAATEGDDTASTDGEVCFICAEPIKFHSIAPCNHKTCHICGLRMRALYKTKDCPHCRTPSPFVIFTEDANKRYEEYTDADITSFDNNIGIRYTNEEIVGDTVVLLRYNCPADDCVFAGLGWPDLHRHVRSAHQRKMCDLCTRNKKVFTHEHELFADKELERHMRHGDDKPGAIDQTGFKGHPLCGFCGSRFYDDDKLFDHCREKHERCFICDRRDSRHPHYFVNYNALEKHFEKDHFPCLDKECLEKKFVVFESEMDLKAHQLAEHANSLSKDVRRDARVVNMSGFDFRPSYENERRGGGGGGGSGSGRQGRGRGRDPNAEPIPQSSAQPLRRDELAFQRQMAIHSAQSVSNRTFGGQLSGSSAPAQPTSSRQGNAAAASSAARPAAPAPTLPTSAMEQLNVTDVASLPPQERATMLRHQSVIERASNLLGKDESKMNTFREHISSFRKGKLTAPQLVDAFFSLFADASSNALGTLVREVADLFEDKTKAQALQKAWQDWRAINEDYPSLPGLGGMQGATTASSGWASAATASPVAPAAAPTQKHSNRVLRLKNSTRAGAAGPKPVTPSASSSNWVSSSPAVRPPPSSAFPALPAASSSSSSSSAAPRPSWIGPNNPSSGGGSRSSGPAARPAGRPAAGGDAFPALPPAQKPLTTIFGYGGGRGVRRDLGGASSNFSWGSAPGSGAASENASEREDEEGASSGGKKKKGKKVLVQWG